MLLWLALLGNFHRQVRIIAAQVSSILLWLETTWQTSLWFLDTSIFAFGWTLIMIVDKMAVTSLLVRVAYNVPHYGISLHR